MVWQETPYTIPLLVGVVVALVSALFTWRYVYVPGARTAAVLLLACAEWTATYMLELAAADLPTKILFNKLSYIGIVAVPTTFLIFALEYTERRGLLTRRNLILLSLIPVATLLLVFTNEEHRLVWTQNVLDSSGSFVVLINSYGLMFWVHTFYCYAILLVAAWLLVQMLLRSRQIYGFQATSILFASFVPWVGNGLYISHLSPFPTLDLTPLTFTVTSLALAWGISGLRFGDLTALARRAAIESMSDGVIVLDAHNRVIDANPAAKRLFGGQNCELVGRSIDEVCPECLELHADLLNSSTQAGKEMTVCWSDTKGTFDVRVSPLTDWRGRLVSKVIVIRDISERKRLEQELARRYEEAKFLADRDSVTGILNHRAVHERMEQELKRAKRNGREFSIVMMDLDDFKLFNDTYGHLVGDRVIRNIGELLAQNGRETDILGRYGGDEFVAILPETGAAGAVEFAERIRSVLAKNPYVSPDGASIPIRMSFGIANYPHSGRTIEELVSAADTHLYESKRHGGDTITVEDEQLDDAVRFGMFGVFDALVTAVDNKDHYTRKHSEDATEYALMIADGLGLSEETRRTLRIAGLLHDVGKIGIPDRILRKPGRLDEDEFAVIKQHAMLGEMIIQEIPNLPDVISAIGAHHERIDGTGYPRGLKGEDIPLLGRILAVADAYSAMTTNRPYRRAKTHEEAKAELLRVAGTQLDRELVLVFLNMIESRKRSVAI